MKYTAEVIANLFSASYGGNRDQSSKELAF